MRSNMEESLTVKGVVTWHHKVNEKYYSKTHSVSTNNHRNQKPQHNDSTQSSPKHTFRENQSTTTLVKSHIQKGENSQFSTFHYSTANKHYLAAMHDLDTHSYPDAHNLRLKALKLLNDVHNSRRSLKHSYQIVKMGLQHEEKAQYTKAFNMYMIAYRIRWDTLGKRHPSLPVLLIMLGSVEVKRGELGKAMQIFKMAMPDQNQEIGAFTEGGVTNNTVLDPCGFYNSVFQTERPMEGKQTNINVAMTLRQIGDLWRMSRNVEMALCAYQAACRGTILLLGNKHKRVGSILRKIESCHKELENFDEVCNIHQKLLRRESYYLGQGHPDVTHSYLADVYAISKDFGSTIVAYTETISLRYQESVSGCFPNLFGCINHTP